MKETLREQRDRLTAELAEAMERMKGLVSLPSIVPTWQQERERTGGSAFPQFPLQGRPFEGGLTKREWLAGMAMQALLMPGNCEGWNAGAIAEQARHQADEMLEELAK